MKKRKIIAKLMVLSVIISNVSGINVQATDNIDVQNDNSIEYNVDTENSETFEESNVDKNIISNETVENDDLISNENEIFEVMEEVEEIDEQFLENEINEEVNYDESEVISEEVTIVSPLVSRAAAIGNVNILSSDSTTVAQAEAWARAKGATEEFVGLASLYQKYASSRGGVNWVVAYVQAAKETGYGKFGGVLDASYHNPCGLKNSSGGADEDPNAHKRFDNWDQGIIAHLDHLALYAGAAGYPKTNYVSKWQNSNLDSTSTYDPRHFAYLKGRATTVNDLGGQWAPSSTYGVEIFRLYCDLTGATYLSAKSNLEDPTENLIISDGKLRVKGWALHAFGVKQVDVYLDGRLLGNIQYGLERTDVYRFFPDYFNSNKSGFDTTFDITSVSNGNKKLEVIITANDGSKNTITRNITVNRLISRSNLDDPYGTADITSNT
ncbi:MAG: glucosaminidase domain-containing protein, partial [Clostridium sp.]|uniref:glucosaminidase domain-containing protein n=1 Tax=Clostridium sp. TaxID=1506 RepID=UPI0039917D8F